MGEFYDINQDDDLETIKAMVKGLSRKLGADALGLVEVAAAVGWKVMVTSPESLSLIAPGEPSPKRIHLSARNRNKAPVRKMIAQIKRYGDPERVQVLDQIGIDTGFSDDAFNMAVAAMSQMNEEQVLFAVNKPTPKERRRKEPSVATPTQVRETLQKKAEAKVKQERRIVSEQPALMHYSLSSQGGRSYPSPTTLERRWSDGTVDYACAVDGCGETSENRLSFRGAHYAMHVRKGEAQPVDMDEMKKRLVDDPSYTEHAWSRKDDIRAARTRALADVLRGIDLTTITPEELAEQIMAWIGQQGGGNGGITEPMTDEQVLDRIRALVDRGTYAKQQEQLEALQGQVSEVLAYAEQVEAMNTDAEARANKAESTLEAFRDLVNEALVKEQTDGTN